MSDTTIVETIYGKHHKYEVVKKTSIWGSPRYYVRRDGKPWRGAFTSLKDAVEAAESAG